MRNVSEKLVEKIQHTHFIFNNFFKKNRSTFVRYVGKNMVKPYRPQTTIWVMRIACWIPKATNTHPDYVKLIANPL